MGTTYPRDIPPLTGNYTPDFTNSHQPLFPTNNIGLTQTDWLNSVPNNMQQNHQHPAPFPFPQQQQQQQQPQQQMLNTAWMNQMQQMQQQFPTGMPTMGFNPLFQQQLLYQNALAMSHSVEASDEPLLVQTLLAAKKRKESYKDAMNGLQGKNGHSASLWKDYYLDHKDHIDNWINMCLEKEKSQSMNRHHSHHMAQDRKSSIHTIKREASPSRLTASAPPITKKRKNSTSNTVPTTPIPTTGRHTLNSMSVPEPVFNDRLPPPHADLKIPEPPSRSPSPPTRVIPQGRGNKYTDEDRQFFLKFISWRLKNNSKLTRNDLCNMLAEKAPHHTSQSWGSHWSNRHDLPDKILAAARGEIYVSDAEDDEEEEVVKPNTATKRKPQYRDLTTDEEQEQTEVGDESSSSSSSSSDEDEDDGEPIRHYSESQMGKKGEPFTDADLYLAAKHVARYSAWKEMTSKDRWEPFAERYTHRSSKSWAEYYRRSEDAILKLAKKIRKEMNKQPLPEQCARPSRPLGKRKYTLPKDEPELDEKHKRSRVGADSA